MWFLVFAAWWHTAQTLGYSLRYLRTWWEVLKTSFFRLYRRHDLVILTLLLIAPTLSCFWSDDKAYWLRLVQTRLPFLVLPWALANFPYLSEKRCKSVLYLLVWFMVCMCIGVGINFVLHYDSILEGLGRGNPVPVPRSHVRFSLILATAILSGGWLWKQKFWIWHTWERYSMAAAVVFLFVFLHFLSVRSGLFALYSALIFLLFRYIWVSKKRLIGVAGLCMLVAVFWIAKETVPSLKTRIYYMKYDWERFTNSDDGHLYSDGMRWISLQSGWDLWQQNPWLGTGAGDLYNETRRNVSERYPDYSEDFRLPHNEFIFIMASTGLLGLTLSLLAFFWPICAAPKNALYLGFQIMAFTSFMIECTIENAIGVAWFLFYSLWISLCTLKNPSVSIS